jgi:dihydropyrimidinase
VAGGTTTLLDFIIPARGQALAAAYDRWRANADHVALANYGLHMAVSYLSADVLAEYPQIVERGVTSFKHFMAYKGALMLNDAELLESFMACKRCGILPMVHAENGDAVVWNQRRLLAEGATAPIGHPRSRPPEVEAEAVERACMLAAQAHTPLMVVHNTCRGSVEAIARAQRAGNVVVGEATAIHLTLDETRYAAEDWDVAAAHVLSPPLRPRADVEALWAALQTGVLRVVATDHCAFTTEQKRAGRADFSKIPNGCPGLEERMMLLWSLGVGTGRITPEEFVDLSSANAARVFNMFPQKGCVAVGSDADIVVWDPAAERVLSAKTHQSRLDISVFEGTRVVGVPVLTIVNGVVAYDATKGVIAPPGTGKYIARKPYGHCYARLKCE